MTPRLHGRCPQCSRVETLRPGGTLTQHTAPRVGYDYRERRCDGSGAQPVAGSVEAWLAQQETDVAARLTGAERDLVTAQARLDATREMSATHAAWITKQRARLAKGRE